MMCETSYMPEVPVRAADKLRTSGGAIDDCKGGPLLLVGVSGCPPTPTEARPSGPVDSSTAVCTATSIADCHCLPLRAAPADEAQVSSSKAATRASSPAIRCGSGPEEGCRAP